ncbi:unnamed protein product [Victoria cruziana]
MTHLKQHIAAVESNSLFEGTDFKLASCRRPSDHRVATECGFTTLSVRVVEELVTLCSHPLSRPPSISHAGEHLSAVEFHSVLQNAGKKDSKFYKGPVLLDARNVYETRIGKFQAADVDTLDPGIRQYSDLPAWIDAHSDKLEGNCILMYCTGGIRCEMASAYLKMKGSGFENVYQLSGGIQRYLEQFPDGGFFKGKNFVFDHRISVGSSDKDVIGSCLICGAPFDDYSSRCRCHLCRMLVLVCDNCQKKGSNIYICELCQKNGKEDISTCLQENIPLPRQTTPEEMQEMKPESATVCGPTNELPDASGLCGEPLDSIPRQKLRILCLHGFRQNASGFKGRLGSFMKKLRHLAEFVFVDAPHGLPFVMQPRPTQLNGEGAQFPGKSGATVSSGSLSAPSLKSAANRRFAWLVSKKQLELTSTEWELANEPFDPSQYQKQTEGWEESFNFLKRTFTQMGPFDGVLGFSQGASVAATLCAERGKDVDIDFKFAILCSGFCTPAFEFKGLIECASLHIFGGTVSKDKQICRDASFKLANSFHPAHAVIVEHNSGHIVPTKPPYINQIQNFLQRFQ